MDGGGTKRLCAAGETTAKEPKGDLYVDIRVKPHKKCTREGELIMSNEHLQMIDAALGTEIEADTVDGQVRMKIPAGTQSDTDFKLSSHGVPYLKREGRGPHIVTIKVDTPLKLSKRQEELLREFKSEKPRTGFFGL